MNNICELLNKGGNAVHKIARVVIAASLILTVAACGQTLMNVKGAKLSAPPSATMDQIAAAIRRAGVEHGWRMEEVSPGKMGAQIHIRNGVATVTIEYDKKAYSINYRSSRLLNYNGVRIHYRYNDEVKALRSAIDKEVARL